jgi:hypothetical protein
VRIRSAILGAALLGALASFIISGLPGPRVTGSPRTKQLSTMKGIGVKLRNYAAEHDIATVGNLKGKTVEDLVAMEVMSSADAAYLREHQVQFYGYDSSEVSDRVPVFEAWYPLHAPSSRIVVYSDSSATIENLRTAK